MNISFPKSLQIRMMICLMGAGILPALILSLILLYSYESRMTAQEINRMTAQIGLLSGELVTSGYLERQEAEGINAELTSVADAYSGRIMLMNSSLCVIKDTYGMYEDRTFLWENVITAMNGAIVTYYDRNNHCLVVTAPIRFNSEENSPVYGVILMSESTEDLQANMGYMVSVAMIFLLTLVLLMGALSYFLSRRMVEPFHEVAVSIRDIEKNEGNTIWIDRYKETEEISESFNRFQDQMRFLDDSRQEFVSNVSHELKTPLASMKVLADSINGMGDQAPLEMYQEFMLDITNEIDRETEIINDLLSLVRMDKSKADLNISIINVNKLLELLLKRLEPLAAKADVELVMESFRPVTAEIDEVKISLAIMNLIENGIKYNNEGGWVHISINSDHQYCFIRVEDNGNGISDEDMDHIFERFYRADKSHSREISGTGLGLAITRDAILLHHGEIKVASTPGEGTVFDVRLPLSYISDEGGRK